MITTRDLIRDLVKKQVGRAIRLHVYGINKNRKFKRLWCKYITQSENLAKLHVHLNIYQDVIPCIRETPDGKKDLPYGLTFGIIRDNLVEQALRQYDKAHSHGPLLMNFERAVLAAQLVRRMSSDIPSVTLKGYRSLSDGLHTYLVILNDQNSNFGTKNYHKVIVKAKFACTEVIPNAAPDEKYFYSYRSFEDMSACAWEAHYPGKDNSREFEELKSLLLDFITAATEFKK